MCANRVDAGWGLVLRFSSAPLCLVSTSSSPKESDSQESGLTAGTSTGTPHQTDAVPRAADGLSRQNLFDCVRGLSCLLRLGPDGYVQPLRASEALRLLMGPVPVCRYVFGVRVWPARGRP